MVFASEFVNGISIDDLALYGTQKQKDYFGELIMQNTLEELFIFNFMQSDPNFSNYFIDVQNK
jgi:aarF domain-containing kinase